MPRSPAPNWRQRKHPLTDDHVFESVNRGLVDDDNGHYTELVYTGIETNERALEIKQSLFRCARYQGYSMRAKIEKMSDGTFQVRFNAIDKVKAKAYVIRTYGPDPANWPYDPRGKGKA